LTFKRLAGCNSSLQQSAPSQCQKSAPKAVATPEVTARLDALIAQIKAALGQD
jgi:hypothetical protein